MTQSEKTQPEQAFAELFTRRSGIKLGLERVRGAALELGLDLKKKQRIIIGGTNGKGSTAAYLWQMLTSHGYSVGLFTSPHLCRYQERFCLSGRKLEAKELLRGLEEIRLRLTRETYDQLSFFEITTLLALKLFEPCDYEILEVGLGGRLDSTNIVDADLAVVTSIGLDHCEFLGNSLPEVAREKAGIFRKGAVAVIAGDQDPSAVAELKACAQAVGAKLLVFQGAQRSYLERNWALAGFVLQQVLPGKQPAPFGGKRWPRPPNLWGRFQEIATPTLPLLVDVCHNPHGARAFVQSYRASGYPQKVPALVSVMKDKDVDGILAVLSESFFPLLLFSMQSERGFDPALFSNGVTRLAFPSFAEAFAYAESLKPKMAVVCGSIHAVGEIFVELGVDPEVDLN